MDEPAALAAAPGVNVVVSLDNELQRFGVERMLQSLGTAVTSQVGQDLTTAVDALTGDAPGILIVASRDVDGPARAALRRAVAQGAKILVLFDDHELAAPWDLASIGGSGYLSAQELSARGLRDTLMRMRDGEILIPSKLAHNLLTLVSNAAQDATQVNVRLTPREQQVLVLLVDGLSNKQIARRLGLSEHGAKRLVANILAKLNCPTRTLAVAKALREGLYEQVGNGTGSA
jgi:DNA-binding NarL/FixJ family response regulator